MRRSSSGISPVVATVILVAIAIVIAIAVAFWASGLVGIFTRFEKLEITAAYWDPTGGGRFVLLVNSTGSADATIADILVNGVPGANWACDTTSLPAGTGTRCTITAPPPTVTGGQWTPGVTYEITIRSAAGKLYPVAVMRS